MARFKLVFRSSSHLCCSSRRFFSCSSFFDLSLQLRFDVISGFLQFSSSKSVLRPSDFPFDWILFQTRSILRSTTSSQCLRLTFSMSHTNWSVLDQDGFRCWANFTVAWPRFVGLNRIRNESVSIDYGFLFRFSYPLWFARGRFWFRCFDRIASL